VLVFSLRMCGSPPPARGARYRRLTYLFGIRITPACAGSTRWSSGTPATRADHPRLRGEHAINRALPQGVTGSPPPARGARRARRARREPRRITPACAGSTASAGMRPLARADHPRLRGEHTRACVTVGALIGSPPPARGAHQRERRRGGGVRITPACAGSTHVLVWALVDRADHPRLRGEHLSTGGQVGQATGSPPPARGAPGAALSDLEQVRITPACAGSTVARSIFRRNVPDHPRLRGEHETTGLNIYAPDGSPPPARGARSWAGRGWPPRRITPACAGSTYRIPPSVSAASDHPRLRGEHPGHLRHRRPSTGSPPPARGARGRARPVGIRRRITPACAGSTPSPDQPAGWGSDHPRLRGEHGHQRVVSVETIGSPPPARGARADHQHRPRTGRITPACAGST